MMEGKWDGLTEVRWRGQRTDSMGDEVMVLTSTMVPLLDLEANEEARLRLLLLRASSSSGDRVCITVSKSGLYTCEVAR